MLNYENFKNYIGNNLKHHYALNESKITVDAVTFNDSEFLSIMCHEVNSKLLIPFDELYEQYQMDNKCKEVDKLEELLQDTLTIVKTTLSLIPIVNVMQQDFSNTEPSDIGLKKYPDKDKIVCILVNNERIGNNSLPHENFDDMSLVFGSIEKSGKITGANLIPEKYMQDYNMSYAELVYCAKSNMYDLAPPELISMKDIFYSLINIHCYDACIFDIAIKYPQLFVLTSIDGVTSSAYITFPEMLEKIYQKTRGEYYLCPKTMNECFIINKDAISAEEFKKVVDRLVLNKKSAPLSNHIYEYNHNTKKLVRIID